MKFLWLFFLITFGLVSEAGKTLDPQPTFLRSFYSTDLFTSSYCIEDGNTALKPGSGSDKFRAIRPCDTAEIEINDGNYLINGIDDAAASIVDLGTLQQVTSRYHLTGASLASIYVSIHFDESQQNFLIARDPYDFDKFQPFYRNETNPLKTTRRNTKLVPKVGHIYLIRISSSPQNNSWSKSELYGKILVIETDPPMLRWSPVWSVQAPEISNTQKFKIVSIVAIIIGSIAMIFACLGLGLALRRRKEGYQQIQ